MRTLFEKIPTEGLSQVKVIGERLAEEVTRRGTVFEGAYFWEGIAGKLSVCMARVVSRKLLEFEAIWLATAFTKAGLVTMAETKLWFVASEFRNAVFVSTISGMKFPTGPWAPVDPTGP
jgi:hypothetical protein